MAKAGFISTAIFHKGIQYLLPELQLEYAILNFNNLHISKKVKRIMKNKKYLYTINENFEDVIKNINNYHKDSWLIPNYVELLHKLKNYNDNNFKIISVELFDEEVMVAGEIGYIIGKTYTSLSGFFKRDKRYNNWGKLQLVLLALYLKENNFDFWNLGHACLKYKIDLGAKVYKRDEFLNMWEKSINR